MNIDKGTLYWSRGCIARTDEKGAVVSCKSIKDCHKLTVYNWLKNIPADRKYDIVEVRFKNTRKGFFRNVNDVELQEGDIVAVEATPGHDIGIVSATGMIAEIKLMKSGHHNADLRTVELKKVYRTARPADIEKWQEAVALEYQTMIRARKIASSLGLNMKIGDVDFQGDKTKAIFYYIADERVDFRELIKVMAETFKIRIEMKQIGARQEAGLIGGIGPCGRELCCAQWMRSFASVSTNSIRYQEISVNPLKLAGQCSKLKCCLNYELDIYLDAWEQVPKIKYLETAAGTIILQKTDILKGIMHFVSRDDESKFFSLSVAKVKEILAMNRKGEKTELATDSSEIASEFKSAVGEDSLTRFDKNRRRNRNRKRGGNNKPPENKNGNGQAKNSGNPRRNNRKNDRK
ncbi:MAG: hypothetical protein LBD59_04920 [Prevotellaceae bacterium]|jgi:cell fate regulator YaaT (PSP1 superfamily)|nr:hypothetical protein [Prevotellaceae bacterium]